MPAAECQEGLRPIRPRWQDGDKVDDFDRGLVLFGASARQLGHMGDPRPTGLKIGAHLRTDLDRTPFDSPALSISRLRLQELSVRIGKVSSQIGLECGLVAFDHKKRIGVLRTQESPQLTVGVQRIKGTDPSTNGQGGKQFAGFWDLVGFFAHSELGPDFFAVVREAGKQMGGISFSRSGPSHRFAIDGEGIGGRGEAGGLDPHREHLLNRLSADLRKHPAIQGPDLV